MFIYDVIFLLMVEADTFLSNRIDLGLLLLIMLKVSELNGHMFLIIVIRNLDKRCRLKSTKLKLKCF
jgi:hypothetical protein